MEFFFQKPFYSYSDPEDKNISISSEIEPLLPINSTQEDGLDKPGKSTKSESLKSSRNAELTPLPVEGDVKVLMRKKATRMTIKHNTEDLEKQQQQGRFRKFIIKRKN